MTVYNLQIEKIKIQLNEYEYRDICIDSVERYQGSERCVIIISTVRSNMSYLERDDKLNKIGFVGEPKVCVRNGTNYI